MTKPASEQTDEERAARREYMKQWRATHPRSAAEKARSNERAKSWYAASTENRDRKLAYNREWRKANPEKISEYSRRFRDQDPARRRAIWVKSKYRLTDDQYAVLLAHSGICDSCGIDKATHIDHNHATGAFRGYLCQSCNWAAGNVKDEPERALGLAEYLSRTRPPATSI